MDIHARHIAVNGRYKQLLPPTSFRIAEGQLALVRCVPEEATAFALALSGRIEPDDGAVLLDGEGDDRGLREQVALVDSPRVTAPEPALPLAAVVAEGLSLAGHPAGKTTVREWLEEHHADEYARYRVETLPAPLRTRLLVELAVIPPQIRVIILDSPDRHTGDAQTWWTVALRQAQRGLGVVVLCADGAARSLPVDSARVGQMQQPAPITVSVDGVHIADVPVSDPRLGTQYSDLPFGDAPTGGAEWGRSGVVPDGDWAGFDGGVPGGESRDGDPGGAATVGLAGGQGGPDETASEQTTRVPAVDQQYGEHQYSDVDFAAQDRLADHGDPYRGWAPSSGATEVHRDLGARLAGSPADAEADEHPDGTPDAAPQRGGHPPADTTPAATATPATETTAADTGTADTDTADAADTDADAADAADGSRATNRNSTEETTTLQRVSDREDSQT